MLILIFLLKQKERWMKRQLAAMLESNPQHTRATCNAQTTDFINFTKPLLLQRMLVVVVLNGLKGIFDSKNIVVLFVRYNFYYNRPT